MFTRKLVVGICILALLCLTGVSPLAPTPQPVEASGGFAWPEGFILPVKRNIEFNITQGPRCSGVWQGQTMSHNRNPGNLEAIDIGMYPDTEVLAPASGKVYLSDAGNGEIYIDVDNSNLRVILAHLNSWNYSGGQHVNQGEIVAYSGNRGISNGAHLHFAVVSVDDQDNETAVPIYQMPGLNWEPLGNNKYPASGTTCPLGANDGKVLYPPAPEPCYGLSIGQDGASNERKFIEAFHLYNLKQDNGAQATPPNSVGCPQNVTHNAGETVGGVNYTLRIQDFVKDGDWNAIILDEVSNANTAYLLMGDVRDEYFAVHNWWMTLGAPINNAYTAAVSVQGTPGLVQDFERGQIYKGDSLGTFATYGDIHTFYYNYAGGGTHSPLGFPTTHQQAYNDGSAIQFFEGGGIYCTNGQCQLVDVGTCPVNAIPESVLTTKTEGSLLKSQHTPTTLCEVDTVPPVLGATNLPGTAVNSFTPKIVVNDYNSGVAWVKMYMRPTGGSYTAYNMNNVDGWWQTTINTLSYSNGQMLDYYFQASDNDGNIAQISGVYQTPVQNDQQKPTISVIDLPPAVDNNLSVNVSLSDANIVTEARMYVRPQNGSYTQVNMTNTGGSWIATYATSSFATGQVLEYYFWASDNYGNAGQVSGIYNTTVQELNLGRGTVTLSFDDGLESVQTKALPIMNQHGFPGVTYVTTDWVGTTGHLTWPQMQNLQNTHGWEVGSHSVTHVELPTVPEATMANEVVGSKQALANHGINATTFATPYGAYDSPTIREIAKVYEGQRGFWDSTKLNVIPYDAYWLNTKSVEASSPLQQVFNWIDRAQIRREWLVLVFHDIADVPDPEEPYVTSTADFQAIVDYLVNHNVPVRTVHQVLNEVESTQVNLFPNGQFQGGVANGWWTDRASLVTTDVGNHGAYPESQHSIKFTGGGASAHMFSPQIPVTSIQSYLLQAFVNTESLSAGEFGFYVDEYDAAGNWISGKWQGQANLNRVRQYGYVYSPTSASVAKMNWQFYLTAGSTGVVYVDNASMSVLDNSVLNGNFEDLENGWLLDWTGDTNYLVVNTQGQGSNGNNSVVFPSNPPSTKHLFSSQVPVDPTQTYFWTSYVKTTSNGDEFGFYVDEYDAAGNWISGKWLGKVATLYDGWKQLTYTPTNGNVAKIGLQYYLLASSAMTVTLDQVSFTTQGDREPPTGNVVNPPSTVDEELALRVQASDDFAGVAWVEVVFTLNQEYYDDMFLVYNSASGYWEANYPTDYIDDGLVLGYEIWIGDEYGNEFYIDTTQSLIQH